MIEPIWKEWFKGKSYSAVLPQDPSQHLWQHILPSVIVAESRVRTSVMEHNHMGPVEDSKEIYF